MLDADTADRLLGGGLVPDDAPPGYEAVACMIEELGAPATEHERSGRDEVVASIMAVLTPEPAPTASTPRRTSMSKRRWARLTAVCAVGAVTALGGLAVAGALPGAAGSFVSDTLGIDTPGPDGNAGDNPAVRGQSDAHPASSSTSNATEDAGAAARDALSAARDQVLANGGSDTAAAVLDVLSNGTPGPGLGADVSAAASDGHAQAPNPPAAASDNPGASHVPTSLPEGGRP